MSAGNYNITIEQGATFFMTLNLKDEDGVAIDLTGHTFRGKVKKTFADTVAVATFSFNVLDQTAEATKGKVEVSISATDTAAIVLTNKTVERSLTKMAYDIESEDVSGFVKRWLQGSANISPEITK